MPKVLLVGHKRTFRSARLTIEDTYPQTVVILASNTSAAQRILRHHLDISVIVIGINASPSMVNIMRGLCRGTMIAAVDAPNGRKRLIEAGCDIESEASTLGAVIVTTLKAQAA